MASSSHQASTTVRCLPKAGPPLIQGSPADPRTSPGHRPPSVCPLSSFPSCNSASALSRFHLFSASIDHLSSLCIPLLRFVRLCDSVVLFLSVLHHIRSTLLLRSHLRSIKTQLPANFSENFQLLLSQPSLDGCFSAMSAAAGDKFIDSSASRPSPTPSTAGSTGTAGISVRAGANGQMSFRR